jgi:hypothetical protein
MAGFSAIAKGSFQTDMLGKSGLIQGNLAKSMKASVMLKKQTTL